MPKCPNSWQQVALPSAPSPARLDGDSDLPNRPDLGGDLGVHRLNARCECAERPLPWTCKESEVARRGGRHLRGELARTVEQAHVGVANRVLTVHDLALDDGLLGDVD